LSHPSYSGTGTLELLEPVRYGAQRRLQHGEESIEGRCRLALRIVVRHGDVAQSQEDGQRDHGEATHDHAHAPVHPREHDDDPNHEDAVAKHLDHEL